LQTCHEKATAGKDDGSKGGSQPICAYTPKVQIGKKPGEDEMKSRVSRKIERDGEEKE